MPHHRSDSVKRGADVNERGSGVACAESMRATWLGMVAVGCPMFPRQSPARVFERAAPPLPSAVRTKAVEGCRHQSKEILLGDKTWLPEPKQIKDTLCQLGF